MCGDGNDITYPPPSADQVTEWDQDIAALGSHRWLDYEQVWAGSLDTAPDAFRATFIATDGSGHVWIERQERGGWRGRQSTSFATPDGNLVWLLLNFVSVYRCEIDRGRLTPPQSLVAP